MITAKALGAMPAFAIAEMGEQKTFRLLRKVGLAENFIDELKAYIPQHTLCEFVSGISRALGENALGLLFSPYLTVADYGVWGQYVLSAPNLGAALLRAQQEMNLHSNTDYVEFEYLGKNLSYSYTFGHKHHASYPDLAYSAIAAMLSIPKHYLGQHWSPSKIEFDFPSEMNSSLAEDIYRCPVLFNRPILRLVFPGSELTATRTEPGRSNLITRGDIVRERAAPPKTALQSILAIVDIYISDRNVSLDRLAKAMGTGPRSIQRQLSQNGISYREILNVAKWIALVSCWRRRRCLSPAFQMLLDTEILAISPAHLICISERRQHGMF